MTLANAFRALPLARFLDGILVGHVLFQRVLNSECEELLRIAKKRDTRCAQKIMREKNDSSHSRASVRLSLSTSTRVGAYLPSDMQVN